MKTHHIFATILMMLVVVGSSSTLRAQCMPNANIQPGFSSVFPSGISSFGVVGPNANGDYLVVGNTTVPAIQETLSLYFPLPNVVNQQFCDMISVTPGAPYFSYVPTAAERNGNFAAFATQLAGVPGVTEGQFSLDGSVWGWRIPAQARTRTVVTEDPNFTPSILASELSFPDGVVFRPRRNDQPSDLLVSLSIHSDTLVLLLFPCCPLRTRSLDPAALQHPTPDSLRSRLSPWARSIFTTPTRRL